MSTPDRFQGPALLSDTAATVFTSSGRSLIEMMYVSNPSGSPVTFTLSLGTDAAGTRLYDAYPIPADTEVRLRPYLVLEDGEIIQASASTASVLNLSFDGIALPTTESFLVQEEDGTSLIILEEGTGFVLLEESS